MAFVIFHVPEPEAPLMLMPDVPAPAPPPLEPSKLTVPLLTNPPVSVSEKLPEGVRLRVALALTVVEPVKVLLAERVVEPEPAKVRLVAPDNTPLIELEALLDVMVRAVKPETVELIVTLPAPDESEREGVFVLLDAPSEVRTMTTPLPP